MMPRDFIEIDRRLWHVGDSGPDCPLLMVWEAHRLARLEGDYRAAMLTCDASAAFSRLAAFKARVNARIEREAEGIGE